MLFLENSATLKLAKLYGFNRVRGGAYCSTIEPHPKAWSDHLSTIAEADPKKFNPLTEATLKQILQSIQPQWKSRRNEAFEKRLRSFRDAELRLSNDEKVLVVKKILNGENCKRIKLQFNLSRGVATYLCRIASVSIWRSLGDESAFARFSLKEAKKDKDTLMPHVEEFFSRGEPEISSLKNPILDSKLESLPLEAKVVNPLIEAGIISIAQATCYSTSDLQGFNGLSNLSLRKLKYFLGSYGLSLSDG